MNEKEEVLELYLKWMIECIPENRDYEVFLPGIIRCNKCKKLTHVDLCFTSNEVHYCEQCFINE